MSEKVDNTVAAKILKDALMQECPHIPEGSITLDKQGISAYVNFSKLENKQKIAALAELNDFQSSDKLFDALEAKFSNFQFEPHLNDGFNEVFTFRLGYVFNRKRS